MGIDGWLVGELLVAWQAPVVFALSTNSDLGDRAQDSEKVIGWHPIEALAFLKVTPSGKRFLLQLLRCIGLSQGMES